MGAVKPWVWTLAGLLLGAILWFPWRGPDAVLADTRWRDSLRQRELDFEVDSAARVSEAQALTARADSAVRKANNSEARYRRLARWADSVARNGGTAPRGADSSGGAPIVGTNAPDSGTPNPATVPLAAYDSLYGAYETADSMVQVLHGAVRDYVQAASLYASQAVAATGRYDWAVHTMGARIEALEGALRRRQPPPRWSAGVLWEPGGAVPVGGWVARDVGPLVVTVGATDGPGEPLTARLGLGLRF